jgi:phospholipid/cholesterol/gamma-HCH transport system substrate-binding protein
MKARRGSRRIHPLWWTAALFVVVVAIAVVCSAAFAGSFRSFVPVTLVSDRSGLVMEPGAKVKMRGVEVGRVAGINGGKAPLSLNLQIFPDQIKYIPANVAAEITATTAFGAKYVDLIYPDNPSPRRLAAGAMLVARNVGTEVNTVFENLVGLLDQIDPAKLNAILSALAEGVRGQGERIGEATTGLNQVLLELNPRYPTIRADFQSLKGFADTYSAAAQNILTVLDAASTTSTTITRQSKQLDALLLDVTGLSNSGVNLLGPNKDNLIGAINDLAPTTALLSKYNPEYTCLLVGAKTLLDQGYYDITGGHNGRSLIVDAALLFGKDQYHYPDDLPVIAARGGPGGKPGCGSLPDVAKNFPVRELVTNTGWGTGVDVRPNIGIGHPFYGDYLPVTRGVPEAPSVQGQFNGLNGPAPGPIPYPGAPPYGGPMYAPDGTPLYPGEPPPPAPMAPRDPGPPPVGSQPYVVPNPAELQPTPASPVPVPAAPSP